MNLGTKIKELRTKAKITQEALAQHLQVSTQAVSKWENGGLPDIELIPKIANYFKVTTDYLFDLTPNDYSNFESTFLNYFQTIPDEQKYYKMFELGFYGNASTFKLDQAFVENKTFEKIMNLPNGSTSLIVSNHGIALATLKQSKPFYMVIPTPKNKGYNSILNSSQKQLTFLQAISNPDFYQLLVFLYTRRNNAFTIELIANQFNLSLSRSQELIDCLESFNMLYEQILEIDDTTIVTYVLNANPSLIGLFYLLDLIVDKPNNYHYYNNSKSSQFFKEE